MIHKTIRTAVMAFALLLAISSPAVAATSAKGECKSGGYVRYIDPATDRPFASQGACVSHVAHGGTLTPVHVEAPFVYEIRISDHPDYDNICIVNVVGTGEPGSQHLIQITQPAIGDDSGYYWERVADDGTFSSVVFYPLNIAYPGYVIVDGVSNEITCPVPTPREDRHA